MTPATAFTKAVCERASKDGHGPFLSTTSYEWCVRGETFGQVNLAPLQYQLYAACCDLQQREYPGLQVIID